MSEKESGHAMGDDPASWPTGRLLSTASRLVEHAWVDALERVGLTHAGLVALHLLQGGPLSQTELARRAHVEGQTMSRTLERLQREGFIERQPDAADRRRHVVSVTPVGRAVWRSSRTLERDVMPPIGDVDAFRSALLSIIESSAAQRWEP